MIKVLGQYKIRTFEYFYFFVMVVYMAQMTKDTARMTQQLTGGNPIPFLIPIVLTIILLMRNRVSFANKNLGIVLLLTTVWTVAIVVKESLYSTSELSYIFFLYYAIIIAYIHCQVFGKRMAALYEDIMVFFAAIGFILWLFALLFPGIASSFFHLFPSTFFGNNFLYLFEWMKEGHRNAGCSWEPGRFAVMLSLAICFNLLRNGVKFRNNRNIIWLLLALLSSQSTTGYSIVIFLYLIFYIRRISAGYILGFIFVLIPIVYGVMQLDFMSEKIRDQLGFSEEIEDIESAFEYNNQNKRGGETVSLDRFISIYYEAQDIAEEPLLGYSRNTHHSYFHNNVSLYNGLTGGILKVFGQYGIPFGLLLYFILFRSSGVLADEIGSKRRTAVFFTILLWSVSYVSFAVPVATAFWFYWLFKKDESNHHRHVAHP